ncbi:hypothetical protein ACFL35_12790 [Candidatus Riflebacteria bacterium]
MLLVIYTDAQEKEKKLVGLSENEVTAQASSSFETGPRTVFSSSTLEVLGKLYQGSYDDPELLFKRTEKTWNSGKLSDTTPEKSASSSNWEVFIAKQRRDNFWKTNTESIKQKKSGNQVSSFSLRINSEVLKNLEPGLKNKLASITFENRVKIGPIKGDF